MDSLIKSEYITIDNNLLLNNKLDKILDKIEKLEKKIDDDKNLLNDILDKFEYYISKINLFKIFPNLFYFNNNNYL